MKRRARLTDFATGTATIEKPAATVLLAMQTGPGETPSGWLRRSFPSGDMKTASAPGACWFRRDVVLVARRDDPGRDGTLIVGFHGSGILPDPTGDFDDIDDIGLVGLERSLREAWH